MDKSEGHGCCCDLLRKKRNYPASVVFDVMQTTELKPYVTQCVNSRSLFESFGETYEDYYYSILTVEKPFLTWIYLRSLQSQMEREGIFLPSMLGQRFENLLATYPDLYVNLEPA